VIVTVFSRVTQFYHFRRTPQYSLRGNVLTPQWKGACRRKGADELLSVTSSPEQRSKVWGQHPKSLSLRRVSHVNGAALGMAGFSSCARKSDYRRSEQQKTEDSRLESLTAIQRSQVSGCETHSAIRQQALQRPCPR